MSRLDLSASGPGPKAPSPRRAGYLLSALAGCALCVGGAAFYLGLTPPKYVATAQIMVEPGGPATNPGLSTSAATQARLVVARDALLEIVDREDLARDPLFGGRKRGILNRVTSLLSRPPEASPRARALAILEQSVAARLDDGVALIEVSITTPDPRTSERLANAVVDGYLAGVRSRLEARQQRAAGALAARLDAQRDTLGRAEAQWRSQRLEMATASDLTMELREQQLREINTRLGAARGQAQALHVRVAQIEDRRKAAEPDVFPEAVASPSIAQLRLQYAELRRVLSDVSARPQLRQERQALAAQVRETHKQIGEEVGRIALAATADLERATRAQDEIEREASSLAASLEADREAAARLRERADEVRAARAAVGVTEERAALLREQQQTETPEARIVATAVAPLAPRGLPPMVLLAAAALCGCTLGLVAAASRKRRARLA